jgi:biofilm PGA synthesis N-glycosyltransferase PgaC
VFVFLLCALVQLGSWGLILLPAFRPRPTVSTGEELPPISIIVCYRNEAPRLEACLTALLQQAHPAFEIIAVDDNSIDESPAIAQRLAEQHPKLRCLEAGPTRPGKKDALTRGIRAAQHERVLLTDADCLPASDQWATSMSRALAGHYELALGVSLYQSTNNSLLNRWQTFESVYVALQYLGFARRGFPYMGVGRNLAYRKSLFDRVGGFTAHHDLPGGDDDLLINQSARAGRTTSVTNPASWTWSTPQSSWRDYWRQKRRHQSAGMRYKSSHQVLLTVLGISHGLFFLLGLWGLLSTWWTVALGAYFLRIPVVVLALRSPFRTKGNKEDFGAAAGAISVGRAILFDALLAPYYLVLTVLSFLPRKEW